MAAFIYGCPAPGSAYALDTLYVNGKYNHPYLDKAYLLDNQNAPEKALLAYQAAMRQFAEGNNVTGEVTAACNIAAYYTTFGEYDSAMAVLSGAFQKYKHQGGDSALMADVYYHFGNLHYHQVQADSALLYHQKALQIRNDRFGQYSQSVASSYKAIADIYRNTFMDYFTAETYYLKALGIREQFPSKHQYEDLASICYNLASTYRLKGDIDKSINYANQAQTFFKMNDSLDYRYFSLCQNALANANFQKYQYRQSLVHFRKAIQYLPGTSQYARLYLPTFYSNMGAAHIELNQPDSALLYLNKALNILTKQKMDSAKLIHTFQQIGVAHLKKKSDSALYYYDKCLELSYRIFGKGHPQAARIFIDIGKYYELEQDYKLAIENIEKGLLIMNYEKLLEKDAQAIDFDVNSILDALAIKSSCQLNFYYQNHQKEYLDSAFENYLLIDKILERNRNLILREGSRLELARKFKYTYEEALNCAYVLYKINPTEQIAEAVFKFIEKNKALVLMDFLHHVELNNALGIPDSVRAKEQSLQTQLDYYYSELNQATENPHAAALHSKIFSAERHLEKLRHTLSVNYPEYFNTKYAPKFYSLKECRAYLQKKDAVLVEYFYGDSALYVLGISPNAADVLFHKIENHLAIDSLSNILLQSLYKDISLDDLNKDFHAYTQAAYELYNSLLAPVLANKNASGSIEKLIIIPDGVLSFVPFEAFIDLERAYGPVNYQDLAYLVHKYNFSYSFSAQVLLEGKQSRRNKVLNKTFVFSYGQSEDTNMQGRDMAIKGTSEEAAFIASLMPATVFAGLEATKSNFLSHIKEANIIHLALHGKSDRENPLKGFIKFRGEKNGLDDVNLYYHEIMNLGLKARMAVLSACETGIGRDFEGEGIYHIARGFRYAGCPTLVSSLWSIDDRSTAQIIKHFYQELALNKNLDLALQSGKVRYLNSADELLAHPRYWAGMLLIGDTSPVNLDKKQQWPYVFGGIILLLLLLAASLKFYKKQSFW